MGSVSSPARDARIRCFTIDSLTPLSLCVKAPEMTDNSFYVYVHRRADTGEPFYYGKGKGQRAWELYRNKWHSRVAAKHGRIVEIIANELSEITAYFLEISAIDFSISRGERITNITPGGVGVGSGKNHPLYGKPVGGETRKKISNFHLGKRLSSQHKERISKAILGNKNGIANGGKSKSKDHKMKLKEASLRTRSKCDVCGMISIPGCIVKHQRFTNHKGITRVS